MQLLKKILIVTLAVFICLYAAGYLFFFFQGKKIIISQLRAATQKDITVAHCNMHLPLVFRLKGINIQDWGTIGTLDIRPSILGLVTGRVILNDISISGAKLRYDKKTGNATTPMPQVRVIFKRLELIDSTIVYHDPNISPEQNGITLTFDKVNFNIRNTYSFPADIITYFDMTAVMPWATSKDNGRINAHGWANFIRKDMKAIVTVEDIDGMQLYPYYADWVNLEKSSIEKIRLNLSSIITGLNNDVAANCHMELTEIVFKPKEQDQEQKKEEKIARFVVDMFKSLNNGKVVLDFTVKTKMDSPIFGFGNVRSAFQDKITQARQNNSFTMDNLALWPSRLVSGTVKTLTELSRSLIDGAVSFGKGISTAVASSFRKDLPLAANNTTQQ